MEIRQVDIRSFADNRHNRVDDRPYGGGPGMVLMPEPVSKAIKSVTTEKAKVIYLSPQGRKLDAKLCRELAQEEHLILLSGHYEGIDERIIQKYVDMEISIGDYVLTNGCAAAVVLVDAMARFIPGVIGHEFAAEQDSFENGLLDCPHYTRPDEFEEMKVPEVLLSGDHQKIKDWRLKMALKKTQSVRPDLIEL